ncbi:spermidine resistance protein [Tulasnella sp. 408]|nr:spermidine resistance protein [Tulasnella sp. 408]
MAKSIVVMTQAEVISDVPQEDAAALNVSPFEGPEKLLEVWFAPSAEDVVADDDEFDEKIGVKRSGLRRVKRETWEEMLEIVKCKVLSVIEGVEMDAYLLRQASRVLT